eukprot:CAMPEP_0198729042 /NCGR_PEP_ID=MMETSP1475-20131203/13948_1 /TAXON_ID= ORGANISM="Unidentified sp., Strain CCMP1999" /NCGR_SAMPLE_ID=MMETSP1475 /ASSEMBLY_ACC=CAM_ASM_001111 /LENGTH=111 /DNA_ID=CAMNT_0044491579 /DNA_START=400 /DNA_END=735 /DNA_ORIENTATION=+
MIDERLQYLQAKGISKDVDFSEGCSICLEELSKSMTGKDIVVLECGHPYHKRCIQQWLQRGREPQCPYCKAAIFSDEEAPSTIRSSAPSVPRMSGTAVNNGVVMVSIPLVM